MSVAVCCCWLNPICSFLSEFISSKSAFLKVTIFESCTHISAALSAVKKPRRATYVLVMWVFSRHKYYGVTSGTLAPCNFGAALRLFLRYTYRSGTILCDSNSALAVIERSDAYVVKIGLSRKRKSNPIVKRGNNEREKNFIQSRKRLAES